MIPMEEIINLAKAAPIVAIFILFLFIFSKVIKNFMDFIDRSMKSKEKDIDVVKEQISLLTKSIDELLEKTKEENQSNKNNIIKIYNYLDSLKVKLDVITEKIEKISKDKN